jgi:hypothetical protein
MRLFLLALAGCTPASDVTGVDLGSTVAPPPPTPVFPAPPPDPVAFEEAAPASPRLRADAGLAALAEADPVATRVHIQTDKPLYRPGETVWLRTWHLASGAFQAANNGGITYELVGPRGDVVRAKLVEQRGGGATNDFELPTNAPGGTWKVRATAPDGAQVEREIVVLGYEAPRLKKSLEFLRKGYVPGDTVAATLKVNGPTGAALAEHPVTALVRIDGQDTKVDVTTNAAGEALVRFPLPTGLTEGDGLLTVLVDESGVTESISRRIPIVLAGVHVEVYPEGGALVADLPSRVYFAATKADGKPADVSGRILDDRGDVVGSFRTFHNGLGRFELTPRYGRSYHLEVAGHPGVTTIPEALVDGCVMRTPDDFATKLDALRVEVRCATPRLVSVVGSLRGQPIDAAQVRVGSRPATVYLAAKDAKVASSAGVARVTVYDEADRPIAERVVMRHRDNQLKVEVTARGGTVGPRDQMTLDVTARDASGAPVVADLAVAVVDDTTLSYADDKQGDIVSRLLVEAELSGSVEEPRTFFKEPTGYALDLLLGTAGWRKFVQVPSPVAKAVKARREEGKVGKKDAKMARVRPHSLDVELAVSHEPVMEPAPLEGGTEVGEADVKKRVGERIVMQKQQVDREVGEDPQFAGVLGALPEAALEPAGLQQDALAGLIGEPVIGAGGLAARGAGLGGGGAADGLGGFAPRGRGYGTGGGNFGSKGEGGIGTIGGDPIILGALDKSLIDAVIKRNLNQIRYCYQRELTKNPHLGGKVTVKFVIAKDGAVSSATTKVTTLNNVSVETCINGRFLRMQFPEPKGGGLVIVSYPFLFSPDGTPDPGPRYDTVRVFPAPRHVAGSVRNDFRDTIAWAPSVRTDAKGKATVSFTLSDAVTSFRATAEGVGGGLVGRGEALIASTLPFSMAVKLPVAAVNGDRLHVPLTLTNDRDTPVTVTVAPTLGADARVVMLPARAGRTLFYDLAPTAPIPVAFSATSDGLEDAFTRTLDVIDAGYPRTWSASGRLGGSAAHELTLTDAIAGTVDAWVKVYPNALSTMVDGLDGLLAMPHGCFEQASSSNYPNLLVLQYLEQQGVADGALAERSRALLEEGYGRLTSFESKGGGYEWFGGFPAHESLTAYGVAQFSDMRKVFPGVDDTMVRRTAEWLATRQDGKGGYQVQDRALDSFGRASAEVSDAYITWSLVGAGAGGGGTALDAALDAEARRAETTRDPYLLALSAGSLLQGGRASEGRTAAARLARLQGADGSFPGADHSITRSQGPNLLVETTALATITLLADGQHAGAVEGAVHWLVGQRDSSGRWGSTQATVLTLKALTRYATDQPPANGGSAIVKVDGAEVGRLAWTSNGSTAPKIALPVTAGSHTVTLTGLDGATVPYTLGATWSTRSPESDTDVAVGITAMLQADRVDMGETIRLTAQVRNQTARGQPMTLARIGIPAGLSVQTWQLDELRDRGTVDFYETGPDEVIVYLRGLAPSEVRTVPIDLLATVPGEYVAPASRAYLYYADDQVAWAPPVRVSVSGG